jgi:hypothetical protein
VSSCTQRAPDAMQPLQWILAGWALGPERHGFEDLPDDSVIDEEVVALGPGH